MSAGGNSLKSIKIAVSGLTGAERNYIGNCVIGEELLKESSEIITSKKCEDPFNGVSIEVASIEAFDDTRHNIDDYREALKSKNFNYNTFDLFLYCIAAQTDIPILNVDKRSFDELEQLMQPSIWNNCIVVLTNADSIVRNALVRLNTTKVTRSIAKQYDGTIKNWSEAIRKCFGKDFKVIPAGSVQSFSILKDKESWLAALFHAIIEIVSDEGRACLLQKNRFRLIEKGNVELKDIIKRRSYEHPIIVGESSKKIKEKIVEIIAGVSVGGVAGATGATIGALIGALAIGIPSFGVAAGAGLAIGAAVGGSIGVGTGVSVTKAISKMKKKEETEKDEGLV